MQCPQCDQTTRQDFTGFYCPNCDEEADWLLDDEPGSLFDQVDEDDE